MYNILDEIQADLDEWFRQYNDEPTHCGKYCYGKTPMQTSQGSMHLATENMLDETVQTVQ